MRAAPRAARAPVQRNHPTPRSSVRCARAPRARRASSTASPRSMCAAAQRRPAVGAACAGADCEQRNAQQAQERLTQPQADDGGLAAMRAAMLRMQSAAAEPDTSNPLLPDPRTPEEVPGGQGKGGTTSAALWPTPAECGMPAATVQSTGRAGAVTRRKGDKGSSPMQIDAAARGSREPG